MGDRRVGVVWPPGWAVAKLREFVGWVGRYEGHALYQFIDPRGFNALPALRGPPPPSGARPTDESTATSFGCSVYPSAPAPAAPPPTDRSPARAPSCPASPAGADLGTPVGTGRGDTR